VRHVVEVATAALIFGVLLAALGMCGCSSESKARAAEATYLGEHLRCVEEADTLAESKACRRGVDARWHVDGGAK
jgi:hypothetical protein